MITRTTSKDYLNWDGQNNDQVNGDADLDQLSLPSTQTTTGKPYFSTSSDGSVTVKDGSKDGRVLFSYDAGSKSGQPSVIFNGKTLQLSNIVQLGFYNDYNGSGQYYTVNLSNAFSSWNSNGHTVYVKNGSINLDSFFSSFAITPTTNSYHSIYDDSLNSSIVGSVANENLSWKGGKDSIDGGDGLDSVDIYDSFNTSDTKAQVVNNSDGSITVKDANTILFTVSAATNGVRTLTKGSDTVEFKNVEKVEFATHQQGGSQTQEYSIDIANTTSVTTDKLFLKDNTSSTLTQTGKVFGSSGSNDSLIIKNTALGTSINSNVEKIQFEGAISDYQFAVQGTQLLVYTAGQLLANMGIQTDTNGTVLSFSDLSTTATLTGLNQAKLGQASVPTTKSGLSKADVEGVADTTKPKFTWQTHNGLDSVGLKVNSNEDGFATLFAVDGSKMTPTAYGVSLSANNDAIVTVAAQPTLTKTALFVFDKANNYLADSYFWLGTTGADRITAINNYDVMFGFGGGDSFTLKSGFTGQINNIVDFQATASNNDNIIFGGAAKAWTIAPFGWTIVNGVAKKNGATVNDFFGAFVGATGTAGEVVAFEYNGNTYLFGEGASNSDNDNTAVILEGVTGITTVGTMANANTIVIA